MDSVKQKTTNATPAVAALSAAGDQRSAEDVAALDSAQAAAARHGGPKRDGLVERLIFGPLPDLEELKIDASRKTTADNCDRVFEQALQSLERGEAFTADRAISESLRGVVASSGGYGLTVPAAFGGGAVTYGQLALFEEQLAANGLGALAVELSGEMTIGAGSLLGYGSDTQQRLYLPMVAEGRLMGFGLTEVGVGVNAKKVRAYVEADPENVGWRLFAMGGSNKLFITNARHGALVAIVARIGEKGKQLGLFVLELPAQDVVKGVDGAEYGFSCRSSGTAAFAANYNARLSFENFPIPASNQIPADGVEVLFYCLSKGRCMLAAMAAGYQRMFAADAAHYARQREGVGGRVIRHELPRLALGRMLGGALMSRSLSHLSLAQDAANVSLAGLRDLTKSAAASSALESLVACERVLGGRSFDRLARVSEARHNMHLFGVVEGEDDLILMGMVKEITNSFTERYLSGLLSAIQALNLRADGSPLPPNERILRITPATLLKAPARVLPALLKLLGKGATWRLAGWMLVNLLQDLLGLSKRLLPVSWLPRYGSVPARLRRYARAADRGLRRQRWSYLGMNLLWQLELTRAQIPLQRFGKRVEHLTAVLAICQHVDGGDESEIRVAALQSELLLSRARAIRILRDVPAIERMRGELTAIGDDLEHDRCSLLQGVEPQPFAHPWD